MTGAMATGTSGAGAGGVNRRTAAAFAALAALGSSGCASSGRDPAAPVTAAIAQPLEDLNLVGEDPSELLQRAQAAPLRAPADCSAAKRELARLDAALAPHLPLETETDERPAALAGDVIRSIARLPFRGVVRRLTGAERRAVKQRIAVIAAVQRRGYLMGWLAPPQCARAASGASSWPASPPPAN